MAALEPERFEITQQRDVEHARRQARRLATAQGLGREDAECVALAVSELATNLVRYARGGVVTLTALAADGSRGPGVQVECADAGPGVADVAAAMRDGFSTGGGLGGGLGGARRLMDDFEIASTPQGTRIVTRKWRGERGARGERR